MRQHFAWLALGSISAICLINLAISRNEPVNTLWILFAAAFSSLLACRYYAPFIARRVVRRDATRLTPASW